MPLGAEVGLGPGNIVSDGDPDPSMERGTVRLCGFRHISTSGFRVRASRASFIAFCNLLGQISRLSTVTVVFDVKLPSLALFPVLPQGEVVFNGYADSATFVSVDKSMDQTDDNSTAVYRRCTSTLTVHHRRRQ